MIAYRIDCVFVFFSYVIENSGIYASWTENKAKVCISSYDMMFARNLIFSMRVCIENSEQNKNKNGIKYPTPEIQEDLK